MGTHWSCVANLQDFQGTQRLDQTVDRAWGQEMTQMTKRQPVMHNIKFNDRFFNHSMSCVFLCMFPMCKKNTHRTRKPRRNVFPWHTVNVHLYTSLEGSLPLFAIQDVESAPSAARNMMTRWLWSFSCFLSDRVGCGDVLFWNPFQTFQTSLIFSERSAEVPYGFYIAYGVLGTLLLICICAAFIVAKNSMKNTQQGGSNAAV